jgi:hypothetical protein
MDNRLVTLPRRDALHDTDQAAEALDVPAPVIRRWRRSGAAMPAGMVPASVPGGLQALWKLSELDDLAEQYHARQRRRRVSAVSA